MTKHRMPDMKEGGVNVTPLIDIVMCLIIFFMLVAKIGVSSGIDNRVDAPQTYLGVKITDMSNVLALNLYPKAGQTDVPQILVDLKGEKGKELLIQADGKYPLREVLTAMKRERGENFKVVINASKDMVYSQIQIILQECAMAQVTSVNFATKKGSSVDAGH